MDNNTYPPLTISNPPTPDELKSIWEEGYSAAVEECTASFEAFMLDTFGVDVSPGSR
jgi:hypothetical protein